MAAVAPAEQPATEMTDVQQPSADKPEDSKGQEAQATGPAILDMSGEAAAEVTPPLTYIDFLPQCFGARLEGADPVYAGFQSVVEQANQWLRSMPQFSAVKCETVDHKLNPLDFSLEPDQCLQHHSSHGRNVFIKALRLWLSPKTDPEAPAQQLAYITILPDHSSGNITAALAAVKPAAIRINSEQIFSEFDPVPVTMEKLNHHLQQKPLPGKILTMETVVFKAVESDRDDKLDTESTLWSETGRNNRLFLFATRVFYVVGQPAFDRVGYYDQIPDFHQSPDGMGLRIKFAPFSQTVARAAVWLKEQHNTRVVNFQSLTIKVEKAGTNGPLKVNPSLAGYVETQGLQESRYIKVLRVFYIKDQKPDSPALYAKSCLTTRLFVPEKTVAWGKSFQTFSKTMQRVIQWLQATGLPVLGMEAVRYHVSPDTEAHGVNEERVDSVLNSHSGQYNITCIRLYFPQEFQEPPPEVLPGTDEDAWGWGCVLS